MNLAAGHVRLPSAGSDDQDRNARMERKRINSGTVRSVGYDERSRMLEIEFTNGSIVQYERVAAEIHRRFLAAPSPGSYFRDEIEESYTARRLR